MFKKFREFTDKLSLKQAVTLTILIPLLPTILVTFPIAVCYFKFQGFDLISILYIFLIGLVILSIFSLLALSILKISYKLDCIRDKNAKAYVIANYHLSYDKYTELKYLLDEALIGAHESEMITTLWVKANYTFWAKFIGKNTVELIVKDASGNIISSEIISDFHYLKAYFEPIN